MENQIIKNGIKLLLIGIVPLVMNACYYDSIQELYPNPTACDTTNVTYSSDVWPVINANCVSCHSGPGASGNIRLANYDEIVIQANNGNLMGAINHESGYSPMPKGGFKLPECDITKIQIWIDDGTPDN